MTVLICCRRPAAESNISDVLEDSDPNVADTWIENAVRPGDPAFSRALASGVTTVQILPGSGALFGGRSVIVKPFRRSRWTKCAFREHPRV